MGNKCVVALGRNLAAGAEPASVRSPPYVQRCSNERQQVTPPGVPSRDDPLRGKHDG